jgi:hypothetical protein
LKLWQTNQRSHYLTSSKELMINYKKPVRDSSQSSPKQTKRSLIVSKDKKKY